MARKIIFGVLVFVLCAAVLYITISRSPKTAEPGTPHKIKVVTTLFPIYDMARYIGDGKADVYLLLPPGMEPHSFEPTPSDIVRINEADIFVYTDRYMEPWAVDIVRGVTNKGLIVVDAGRGTTKIPAMTQGSDESSGAFDPHIWLDFDNAKIMAADIEAAFEVKDPANRDFFRQRLQEYDRGLSGLDAEYRNTLAHCRSREIVYGGHYAFGYLARRYGLKYRSAQGLSPNSEPTAEELAALVDQIRRDHIRFIFYEELMSPKIAETLSGETQTKLLPLNPAANVSRHQLERGVTFFDILRSDLENLKIGLGCG